MAIGLRRGLIVFAAVLAVVAVYVTRPAPVVGRLDFLPLRLKRPTGGPALPTQELVARYGRPKYSQYFEEQIARDFFNDERGGFFVDIGAGDALYNSTTAFLEKDLGWTGIAVDAEPKHLESYLTNRRGTRFFAYFVGDKDGAQTGFFVNDRDWRLSSGAKEFADAMGRNHMVEAPTIKMDTLLQREGVAKIDFLSMDIEQGEPAALEGFDIRRYSPRLICIEVQAPTKDRIEGYMSRNGWIEVQKYRLWDHVNRWYVPGPEVPTSPVPPARAAQK